LTVFQAHPFGPARALLRDRFQACAEAYRLYKSEVDEGESKKQGKRPGSTSNTSGAWACDMLSLSDCSGINACEFGSCDLGACDIGSCSW